MFFLYVLFILSLLKSIQCIIGGFETYQLYHPYMVSIMFKRSPHRVCGGTLIREDFVLSAAHCFDPKITSDEAIGVRLGVDRLGTDEGRLIPIDFVKTHPNYRSLKTTDALLIIIYDIALVKLKMPLSLNHYINIISLSHNPLEIGEKCYALGFGIFSLDYLTQGIQEPMDAFGGNQHVLRMGNQTIVPLTRCQKARGEKPTETRNSIDEDAFLLDHVHACAIGETEVTHSMTGPSYGDAGGPLICNAEQYGIFSLDILDPTLDDHHYMLYQRISAGVLDWLDQTMYMSRLIDATDLQGEKYKSLDPEAGVGFNNPSEEDQIQLRASSGAKIQNIKNIIIVYVLLNILVNFKM